MDMLITMLAQYRRLMLSRQAAVVRAAVEAMTAEQRRQAAESTLAEIRAAAALPLPHLYGDTEGVTYRPWSPVAETMARRARDRAVQLRLRSIALWLAVVYHETREARGDGLQAVHREVLGILRELREAKAPPRTSTARLDVAA
jgi:hypothetical protein